MAFKTLKYIGTIALSTALALSSLFICSNAQFSPDLQVIAADAATSKLTIDDLPGDYKYAADWIWENRIVKENSTGRTNTIFDQIIAGKGTINYVVKWQSYKSLTLKQRQDFETLVSNSINAWASWLSGYENWPYDHINVKIVGWAVIDKNCILDRQPDEIVYTDAIPYDSSGDTAPDPSVPIPDKEPLAPSALSRFDHFADKSYEYPGGLDKRFDMYLWGTQGFPSIGGCGGDWGQRLSDDAFINMLDGSGLHVLEHELGHGFGMTDFYGGEGESNGFPPGGFPGGENSLMMAGSAMKITDFDGWMLRYMWSKLSKEEGRFDIPDKPVETAVFTDTITAITDSSISFAEHNIFNFGKGYYGSDESKNLSHYEVGDKISISFTYNQANNTILNISSIKLIENIRDDKITLIGDVNMDNNFNISDIVMLQKWLVRSGKINNWHNGNLYKDNLINVLDLCLMKKALITGQTETVSDFIDAPIKKVEAYLPSQNNGNLIIFYVDFPDCKYDYAPTADEINEIAFGTEDTSDENYPFDSMSAFYNRSSKGSMKLNGTTFRYTTKENVSAYGADKSKLAMECYDAFKDSIDFSQFDGDSDGFIDATLFSVPTKAGDTDWWPCAGPLGRNEYTVDGMKVGHIITGNAQIESINDYKNFNSSYLHEMGHCMGLPDFYLYSGNDSEGLHGTAGLELMDADASSDFSAVSKLQLGWFRKNQIQAYNGSAEIKQFTLNNAQSNNGNCVIIPRENIDENYQSEYFLIEYSTADGNNSNPQYGIKSGSGVRVYHVDATILDNGYWVSYKYASGSEFTNNDAGRRFIRIIDDSDKDNYYYAGSTIDNSITGFNWYDDSGNQNIDPGIKICVNEINGDSCTITVSKK